MKEVFIDFQKCTGCKSCEIACAVEHSSAKSLLAAIAETPPPQRRIHVEKASSFSWPVRCMHCKEAACIAACPSGAMRRVNNRVVLDDERCMGCMMCAMLCPFGAISANDGSKSPVKCDHCAMLEKLEKEPACVAACPTAALVFVEPERFARDRRARAAEAAAYAEG